MDQAEIIIAEVALLALLCLLTARQARAQRRDFAAELAATRVTTLRLQGIDLDSSFLSARWTQKDHVLAIERTLRQPGPYAPWAFQPIPTMEPLAVEPTLGMFPLSVPLTTASRDTPPAPVPETRYPVTDSPWQGAPEQGS